MTSFDASITGDELDSTVYSVASELQVGRGMVRSVRAIYSTRLALFIHGITSAKKTRDIRPAIFVGESSPQLQCVH